MRIVQSILVLLGLLPLLVQAQWNAGTYSREGRWEASTGLYLTGSRRARGDNQSSLDIEGGLGLGFSAGYNFTPNLALHFDGSWFRAGYDAVLDTENQGLVNIDHTLTAFTGQLKGVWNIFDAPFTPYLQAGVGWTFLDSNVSDSAPVVDCWWDPWWGYICSDFYSTYSDTNFSWNVGAGLRYEFRGGMFARAGWERITIDSGQGAEPDFDAYRFELGWLF
ncbi:MAG: outer membrane beta-barrel protein [Wenzhouxiangella sp.]|jgi:opacity protein-like surface antigen|nr:outer membrane beta-barrel protein [Wenzhouxiangella sp.]